MTVYGAFLTILIALTFDSKSLAQQALAFSSNPAVDTISDSDQPNSISGKPTFGVNMKSESHKYFRFNASTVLVDSVSEELKQRFNDNIFNDPRIAFIESELDLFFKSQPTNKAFVCLNSASDVVNLAGFHDSKYTTLNAKNRAFDARSATFLIEKESHGMIASRGGASQTGMCWAGGYSYSSKPWDASWDDHKDLGGTTRNSSVINNASYGMTVTGMHFFNVHDGPRSNNGVNWTVQHVWGEYVRDDCIENDHFLSGRVYDSLFDGCYSGISTRSPRSSTSSSNGQGHVVTLEKVLLRLHPMPYPYKWQSKSGNIDENGNSYNGIGIPYRHGKFFKYEERNLKRNNHFVLKDSIFAAGFKHIGVNKFNLPHPDLIDQCQGITFAWLGDSRFPGGHSIAAVRRKFPSCITILEGQEARDFWRQKVIDWHQRHPDVGRHRKPANTGEVVFPLRF